MNSIEKVKEKIVNAKALLFDFDGTLVNLDNLNVDAFRLLFKELYNLEFTKKDFMTYISGKGSKNGITEYLIRNNVREFSADEINNQFYVNKKRLIEEKINNEIYLLPGIKEFLENKDIIKKKKIIVTSSRKEHVERILTHFNILNHFEKIFDRHSIVRGKPAPDIFIKGVEYLNIKESECVAFEDSFYGLQSAKGANLFTVGILNKGWNDDFVYQLSDYVVESYLELIN